MHRLLKRQIDRYLGDTGNAPGELEQFLAAVDSAYDQYDTDRAMLERSLELSSQELLQANSEMAAVFHALPDLFFRIDSEGTIIDFKGASAGDFYLAPEELLGKHIQDVREPGVGAKFASAITEVLEKQSLVSTEYSLKLAGQERFYEARMLPLVRQQIVVIIRNITDRVEAQRSLAEQARELARSNSELEQFAYVASHDLQEPLRTVQSYMQLLERRYGGNLDGTAHEFIGYAVDAAKRMRELINDLLTYARVSSRAKPFEPFDLNMVLDEVLANLSVAIAEQSATVTREGLPSIMCDRRQLSQLFQNLIANAIKFRGKTPPHVHVSAIHRDGEYEITVKDNGIGIDPKYAEKIFVIFQRLHTKDEYPGTGIGLAVCKKIVERHGGNIWVTSEPGNGATFQFTILVRAEERA